MQTCIKMLFFLNLIRMGDLKFKNFHITDSPSKMFYNIDHRPSSKCKKSYSQSKLKWSLQFKLPAKNIHYCDEECFGRSRRIFLPLPPYRKPIRYRSGCPRPIEQLVWRLFLLIKRCSLVRSFAWWCTWCQIVKALLL